MESGGYGRGGGSGGGNRGRSRNRGIGGGGGGPPRGAGRRFRHRPQPDWGRAWSGDETRRVIYAEPGGKGSYHPPQPQRGQSGTVSEPRSGYRREGAEKGGRGRERGGGRNGGGEGHRLCVPCESVDYRRPPSDPVPKMSMLQYRQGSSSSCMLEAKDETLPVHRPDKGATLAIGTDRLHVKLKPESIILQHNVDGKYRILWGQVIGLAAVVVDEVLKWKSNKP